jgi:type I restriction enzyme, R subunit
VYLDKPMRNHTLMQTIARANRVYPELLARLRSIFTVDWQKTALSRARVRDAIEEALDEGLPRAYTPDVFKAKAGVVFQHIYERYGLAA